MWNTFTGSADPIHIKTNIPIQSNTMYRLLVEGYNYGASKAINSDAVGYTYALVACLTNDQTNDYATGVTLTQYCSADGYVVLKLTVTTSYFMGFSVSAWFTNPLGGGFDISAQAFQQASDL